jgi:hypothetical protein
LIKESEKEERVTAFKERDMILLKRGEITETILINSQRI